MYALDNYETKRVIREGLQTMEFASLPAVVKAARDLTRKVETLTIDELAALVSKDPFALAKVFDTANRGGRRDALTYTKLNDAILKIGFSKVRGIAYNLLDMEAAKDKLRYHEQGVVAAHALCACLFSEAIIRDSSKLDPHTGYAVTVLRSYGKVLMSSFLIQHYREVLEIMEEEHRPEDSAFLEIFGVTPLELTHDLLRESNLPREFLRCLRPLNPEVLDWSNVTETDQFIICSEFSIRLTELLFDHEIGVDAFEKQSGELLASFRGKVSMRPESLPPIFEELDELIVSLKKNYGIEPLMPGMDKIIRARVLGKEPPPPPPPEADPDDPSKDEEAMEVAPERVLMRGAKELAWLSSKRKPDYEQIYQTLSHTLYTGLKLQDFILFTDEGKSKALVPTTGKGDIYELVREKMGLVPGNEDIFGIALKHNLDAHIFDASDPKYHGYIPNWVRSCQINSMILLPVGVEGKSPHMLIFGARSNGTAIQMTESVVRSVAMARKQMVRLRSIALGLPRDSISKDLTMDFRSFTKQLSKNEQSKRPRQKRVESVAF